MFATRQHSPSPVRRGAPPGAKDVVHRSPSARQNVPNAAWHLLATNVRISEPHEPAEQEAHRVADAVVQGRPAAVQAGPAAGSSVHRMCAGCADEQRREEEVHAQRQAGTAGAVTGHAGHLAGLEGRGQPLPEALRGDLEPRFGRDLSDVRLHTDAAAGEAARDFNALAFTYGRHVVFGAGQFDPVSLRGRRLLAHELVHVAQQGGTGASLQRQEDAGVPASGGIIDVVCNGKDRGSICSARCAERAITCGNVAPHPYGKDPGFGLLSGCSKSAGVFSLCTYQYNNGDVCTIGPLHPFIPAICLPGPPDNPPKPPSPPPKPN